MTWFQNATQSFGLAVYGLAALACAIAAGSAGPGHTRRSWWWLAGFATLLLLDLLFNLRHGLHDHVGGWLKDSGRYAQRRELQWALIGLFAALVLLALLGLIRWVRPLSKGLRLAVLGAGLAAGLVGLEMISLHDIDAWLYARQGPLMRIAWLWGVAAALMIAGARWPTTAICRPGQPAGTRRRPNAGS